MSMNKCRKAFKKLVRELWAKRNINFEKFDWLENEQRYKSDHTQFKWELWQSRQAEVDELNQLYLKAQHQEIRHRTIAQDALALVDEKDKRIEEALNHLNDVRNKGMDQSCYLALKALRGNNANS